MLDSKTLKLLKRPLAAGGAFFYSRGVRANSITITGFLIGALALPLLAAELYLPALLCILINRIMDGIDGELARLHGATDVGGFLDISLDFLFYALVPLGFAFANPEENALAAACLLFSFIGTGSSFLAFAVMAEKRQITSSIYPTKSIYYMTGLTEGTETIVCFVLMCLLPQYFAPIAGVFCLLCLLTTASRIYSATATLKNAAQSK